MSYIKIRSDREYLIKYHDDSFRVVTYNEYTDEFEDDNAYYRVDRVVGIIPLSQVQLLQLDEMDIVLDAEYYSDDKIIVSSEETCGGCPTIYEFKAKNGDELYFRLRHGGYRIVNETTNDTIASDYAEGDLDGVCGFDYVEKVMIQAGFIFE